MIDIAVVGVVADVVIVVVAVGVVAVVVAVGDGVAVSGAIVVAIC